MDSLDILLEYGGVSLDQQQKEKYAALKNEWYVEYIRLMGPDEILPGVVSFLDQLKSAGWKTALGSASKNAPLILERTGLYGYFDAVVDGNDITHAKPDPEIFLLGASRLSADPADCVVFEDAAAGITAARRAGMYTVGVGSPDALKEADTVISGFDGFTVEMLKKMN